MSYKCINQQNIINAEIFDSNCYYLKGNWIKKQKHILDEVIDIVGG